MHDFSLLLFFLNLNLSLHLQIFFPEDIFLNTDTSSQICILEQHKWLVPRCSQEKCSFFFWRSWSSAVWPESTVLALLPLAFLSELSRLAMYVS